MVRPSGVIFTLGILSVLVIGLAGCASIDSALSAKPLRAIDTNAYIAKVQGLAKKFEVEPVPIGLDRQVFYDDALISSASGSITRNQGHPVKVNEAEPVMVQDRSWEHRHGPWGIGLYLSVLTNEAGAFRCWYQYGRNNEVGYAVSENGLEWRKPRLGLMLDNRVMFPAHGPCIMEDPHDPRAGHRFKAIYGGRGKRRSGWRAVLFAHSDDGISWSEYDDVIWLDDVGADTGNSMMWDEELGLYRIFIRPSLMDRRSRQMVRPAVDSGMLAFLKSLMFVPHETHPWITLYDMSIPGAELYSFFCQRYGSIYIGYMQVFITGDYKKAGLTPDDRIEVDINDFYITTSRDGMNWDLTWVNKRQPFLERGPAGSFDQNGVWPPSSPLLTRDDKHWIFYCGRWIRHSMASPGMVLDGKKWNPVKPRSAIGAATIRMDGLIYRENGEGTGTITTKSFVLEGSRIEVNADPQGGELRVELLEESGQPLPGHSLEQAVPIRNDGCHNILAWNDDVDLTPSKGKTMRLRFSMTGPVRLYAFQVLP